MEKNIIITKVGNYFQKTIAMTTTLQTLQCYIFFRPEFPKVGGTEPLQGGGGVARYELKKKKK